MATDERIKPMAHVVIQYAKKKWDRGEPLTRTVAVPDGYTEAQIEQWLYEKLLLKRGEAIIKTQQ